MAKQNSNGKKPDSMPKGGAPDRLNWGGEREKVIKKDFTYEAPPSPPPKTTDENSKKNN